MGQGKILNIHGQNNTVSATTLEKRSLSSSPYQYLGSRGPGVPPGERTRRTLKARKIWKCISYQRVVWPRLQDQKSPQERWRHSRRRGEDDLSWESGDSSTDPTCLQRASLQPSVSRSSQLLQTCTCTSGIFYLTYPYWVQIVICFLNAPPLVLCKQPESVLDRRSDSSLPPLEINAWCVPSALRIEAGSSQVCSH